MNVVGGLKLQDPGADLTVLAALISSQLNKPLPKQSCYIGEIGLTGEVRPVPFLEFRIEEAKKLGFKHLVLPERNRSQLENVDKNLKIVWVKNVYELVHTIVDSADRAPHPELGF